MNDTPLRDPITPYYANSGLLKFRDILKLYTCLIFYEHSSENKPSNFPVPLVSEQHNCFTRSASAQQLLIPFSRINIRKFCPTVIGKYYWNALPVCIRDLTTKSAFKKALLFLTAFSSVSVCGPCVCVCTLCFVMCIILDKRAIA